MNKRNFIIASTIGFLILIIGYIFLYPHVSFVKGDHIYEKGSDIRSLKAIEKANCEVIPEDNYLYTEKIGEYELNFKIKKGIFKNIIVYKYEVIDTTPPIIEIKERVIYVSPYEYYGERNMKENVSVDEGTLEFEYIYQEDNPLSYRVDIKATDESGNVSYGNYEVRIKDNTPPLILRSGDGTQLVRGSIFNINNHIGYGDNLDPRPNLEIIGDVDIYTLGYYPLTAIVTDYSGNETSWSFTIEVVDKKDSYDEDIDYYDFDDFKNDHYGQNRKYGLDVSEWQGDIDYKAVKDAGCDFVFIRIGWSFEGELNIDKKFRRNIEGFKEVGIPVGIYLFSYDYKEKDLLIALDKVFEELNGIDLELPIVFDWETFYKFQDYEMSFSDLNRLYDAFEKKVTEQGYKSMLYGSAYYLNRIWLFKDTRAIWMAQYTDVATYEHPYVVWQVTDSGKIDGIEGTADFNIWFMDE